MKLLTSFTKTLCWMLLFCSTIIAQLELSVYTDKDSYKYGEQIKLYCKVTNNADTTFKFFASSYGTCQAKFAFNNFKSWKHTICLPTTELLTFKPHNSKIYSWEINPAEYGLPNNDGTQMIIGKYYYGLSDTIYINAPQYLGGQVNVEFLLTNSDSVESIKDSLNVTVLHHSDYGTVINEQWQVDGFQIDSVINHFQKDSILTYIEKSVIVSYDNITVENPLNFYPLNVGNKWIYKWSIDNGGLTYVTTSEITHKEIKPNGLEYFHRLEEKRSTYERVDPSTGIVYNYDETADSTNYEIVSFSLTAREGDTLVNTSNISQVYSNEFYGEIFNINTHFYSFYIPEIKTYIETFAYKFGSYKRIHGLTKETSKTLKGCIINGTAFGDTTVVNPENILLRESTLYLFQNALNSNYADTTWLINRSSETLIVDSVINKHFYSYNLSVLFSDETSKLFSLLQNYIDTIAFKVDPNDSVQIILSKPDLCPICDGSNLTYFTDSLQIFNNSKNNPILILGIIGDGTLDVQDSDKQIKSFSLSQNYPNPFNPNTIIRYEIGATRYETQYVDLSIYNSLGQKVATLVNKEQKAGNYKVQFEASNLTSGVYFYRLQSGDFVKSKKMILIK